MPGKKGGGILAMLAGGPKRGDEDAEAEESTEPSESNAETMAAEDMIAAIKSDDAKGLASAYRRLKAACEAGGEADESEESEEGDAAYGE
jgi:hypothetical protein